MCSPRRSVRYRQPSVRDPPARLVAQPRCERLSFFPDAQASLDARLAEAIADLAVMSVARDERSALPLGALAERREA